MEFIFELIIELLFEFSIEASSNKKIPKIVRYPLIAMLFVFFSSVIGGLFAFGIILWNKSILASLFLIIVSLVILFSSVYKFKSVYIEKRDNL